MIWKTAIALLLLSIPSATADELRVPAYTAYLLPKPDAARVTAARGITGWQDPKIKIAWYGEFKSAGKLAAALGVRVPKGVTSKLRLTVGSQAHDAEVTGNGESQTVRFGEYAVAAGYQSFVLEALGAAGGSIGDVEALLLDGAPVDTAHFNLDARRNAASVHLMYPTPDDAKIEWFYTEVTAIEDPVTTFYMACGFHRGYFGMQVNSEKERRIIFSVWDAGTGSNAKNRSKVDKDDQVSLVAKGDGVYASVFGNEGTGGHSHLKYMWKTGQPQCFLLTAKPVENKSTIYSGYYFHPDRNEWMLIASMKAPRDGGYLRRLHGFSENFGGSNGNLLRKALYGNQWIRTTDGVWTELTTATFSHDATGKKNRLDRYMGVEGNQFFLSHGGFVAGSSKYGERFTRAAGGKAPEIRLP